MTAELPARSARFAAASVAGVALGVGLWLASPLIAGRAEPWDASFPLYLPVMLAGGALVRAPKP